MAKQWFILNTFTGKESSVADSLKQLQKESKKDFLGEVFFFADAKNEKSRKNNRLYPGYVFAEIDLYRNYIKKEIDEKTLDKISSIDGVIGFLGGSLPKPLSEDEISSIRGNFRLDDEKQQAALEVGDDVKILDGAFANSIGTISKKDDEKLVAVVEFKMFEEDMSAEVPYSSLEKVED